MTVYPIGGIVLKTISGLVLLFFVALLVYSPAQANDKTTALFKESSTLSIELNGPIKEIARRAARSTNPYPATLRANGETHQVQLSARGKSRRNKDACRFPPLSVRFVNKPAPTSLFAKQGKIKLVTHCRQSSGYEQIAMREYATYRIYNLLTPESLKVRLVQVQYIDEQKPLIQRYGFFIEDIDDAARRLGGKEIDIARVSTNTLNATDVARYTLFQYMISNVDWAMIAGPKGSDCCHNSKLVGANKAARTNLTPVPYDFDGAGLVNAPYALPSDRIPIKSVRQRYYRGLCRTNEETKRIALNFLSTREAATAEINAVEGMSQSSRKQMLDFLKGFYRDIASAEMIEKKILKTCR